MCLSVIFDCTFFGAGTPLLCICSVNTMGALVINAIHKVLRIQLVIGSFAFDFKYFRIWLF